MVDSVSEMSISSPIKDLLSLVKSSWAKFIFIIVIIFLISAWEKSFAAITLVVIYKLTTKNLKN